MTRTSGDGEGDESQSDGPRRPGGIYYGGAGFYVDLGLRFAVFILLSTWIGYKLDHWLNSLPWLTIACSAAGFAAAFYWLMMRMKEMQESQEDEREE